MNLKVLANLKNVHDTTHVLFTQMNSVSNRKKNVYTCIQYVYLNDLQLDEYIITNQCIAQCERYAGCTAGPAR